MKTFSKFFKRFSPETQTNIKLFGIVMVILIIVLGGIVLFFGNKDMIADAFKPGVVTPTLSATPTIIFNKNVLGAEESQNSQATPTKANLTKSPTATPSKILTKTPTQTPSPTSPSSTSTPTQTPTPTSTPVPTSVQLSPTSSQNSPDPNSLYLFRPSNEVSLNADLDIEVKMNSLKNINAVEVKISYPTESLEFKTIDASGGVFDIQTIRSGGEGKVTIVRASTSPKTGNVLIAKIIFKAIKVGSAAINIDENSSIVSSDTHVNVIENRKGGIYIIQ